MLSIFLQQMFTFHSPGGGGSNSNFLYEVDISPDSEDRYLIGHKIDGRVLFPATGYLVLAWRSLAKMKGRNYKEMPVEFKNVHIHRATILPNEGSSLCRLIQTFTNIKTCIVCPSSRSFIQANCLRSYG